MNMKELSENEKRTIAENSRKLLRRLTSRTDISEKELIDKWNKLRD